MNMPLSFLTAALVVLGQAPAPPPRDPAHLLADPAALAQPAQLPPAKAATSMVHRGIAGQSGFNLHSYLVHYRGRFWAMWSSSKVHEEDPDQHLVYATSRDGHHWSAPQTIAADPDGPEGPRRWIARSLFVDQRGKLRALGALIESADYRNRGRGVVWQNLDLISFTWAGRHWRRDDAVFAHDCMNNFPPLAIGALLAMPCRDSRMDLSVLTRPSQSAAGWTKTPIRSDPPFNRMDEPTLYIAADGSIQMIIRDGNRSRLLIRSVSADGGRTWSAPVLTDYPDATSKNFVLRLSTGSYVLINNPDTRRRDPLALSTGSDGWTFGHPLAVRSGAGHTYQYPHAIEHGGSLWIIYSTDKRDIEIAEIPLAALAAGSSR
jgi:hypothetical protein